MGKDNSRKALDDRLARIVRRRVKKKRKLEKDTEKSLILDTPLEKVKFVKPKKVVVNPPKAKPRPTPEDRFLDTFNLSGRQINANKQHINIAKKYSADLIKKATDSEKTMYKYLFYRGIEFEFQKVFYISKGYVIEKFYIADFYFKKAKLIVELDGGYHDTIEQIELDKKRTKALNKLGYKVFRYSNDATYNMDSLWNDITKYYNFL